MEYRPLGRTGMSVSSVCLGTMTYGEQNTEAEGHEQMDYALERGINFFDTAELYAIPPKAETQGTTETIIGTWLAARKKRDDVIIATKIVGRTAMDWFREGGQEARHSAAQIDIAIEGSLRRMQTDYIDLYQLHWPDRRYPGFGYNSYYDYDADDTIAIEDIYAALQKHVEKGNIRAIGLSNESAWGTMKFLDVAKQGGGHIASIQNVYNLVARRFDYGQAEIAMREGVGLLPYSPLAQGYLTGKYENGALPKGSRKQLFQRLDRYESPECLAAVTDCVHTAKELGLTPTQFALKFAETREFVTSSIIGATTMAQLKDNIDAHELTWTDEMEKAAARIHREHRSPAA